MNSWLKVGILRGGARHAGARGGGRLGGTQSVTYDGKGRLVGMVGFAQVKFVGSNFRFRNS